MRDPQRLARPAPEGEATDNHKDHQGHKVTIKGFSSLAVLCALCGSLPAQPPDRGEQELLSRIIIPGEAQRTAWQFNDAEHLVDQGKWNEALDVYQRILKEAGDDLVPLGARHRLHARRLCHLQIAALPAEALKVYRNRVDGQAKLWLDEGIANQDAATLRRLVNESFCSRHTESALDMLGDLAFERGRFAEAEDWWSLLALPASYAAAQPPAAGDAKPREAEARWMRDVPLVFPDPQMDLGLIRAKQLLAHLFEGYDADWQHEWAAFQKQYPKAQGRLAGKSGVLADILQTLARERSSLIAPPLFQTWWTFAGAALRNRVERRPSHAPGRPNFADEPEWIVNLRTGKRVSDAQAYPENGTTGYPQHPIIVDNKVLVADAYTISGYDLRTGDQILHYDPQAHTPDSEAGPGTNYTLTSDGQRVYARLGAPGIGPRKGGESDSYLVCLNLNPGPHEARDRWTVRAPNVEGSPATFEGAPLVHQGRVYVGVTHFTGIQTRTAIACYAADTGARRWQTEVCETIELKEGERRYRQHLLTLAGSNIVYCSHSGAIVAVDAATGHRVWAYRYPSRGPKTVDGEPSPRGLTPCLAVDGGLIVAPLDLDRILCLDPSTGHSLWESNPVEVVDLLGVSTGRLIFTSTMPRALTPVRSIRALDLATGTAVPHWMQPGDGSDLAAAGRGLLAQDRILWPTARGLYVVNLEGRRIDHKEDIHGNLATANGFIAAATRGALFVYALTPQAGLR
jgi:outer membrane protein assembly factor BamB